MSDDEKLRPSRSLSLREIPNGPLQDTVQRLRSLQTKEEWAEITKTWTEENRQRAVEAWHMNQSTRNDRARGFFYDFVSELEENPEDNPGIVLLGALLCLPDKQLGLAVS